MKLNMRLKSCSPIWLLLVLTFVAMPLPGVTVVKCGIGGDRQCGASFEDTCRRAGGTYKSTAWYDANRTKVSAGTCTLAAAPPKPTNGFPTDSLNVRPNSYAQPQTARTTNPGNCTYPPCPWETNRWPWNGSLRGTSLGPGTTIVLLDTQGKALSQAPVTPDGSYSLPAPKAPLQGPPRVCVVPAGSQKVCGGPGDNAPNLTLGGRSVQVMRAAVTNLCSQTQTRLSDQLRAVEACTANATKERRANNARGASVNCWNAFQDVAGNQLERRGAGNAAPSGNIEGAYGYRTSADMVCTPEGGGATTVMVCGHPGGDPKVVACCASGDGCFIYRKLGLTSDMERVQSQTGSSSLTAPLQQMVTGKVLSVNPHDKTFTIQANGKQVTFFANKLMLPEVGTMMDIRYIQPTPGGPMEATAIHPTPAGPVAVTNLNSSRSNIY